MDIELEWLQATLNDASEALQDALQKVENGDQEDALEVLNHDLVHVYAKLNYAVNTARLGPAALDAMSEDELIGWPARMPFLTFDEIDTLGEDEEDEEAVEEEDVKEGPDARTDRLQKGKGADLLSVPFPFSMFLISTLSRLRVRDAGRRGASRKRT